MPCEDWQYIRGLREYKVKLSGEEARRVLAAGVPADMQNGEIEVSLYDQIWQAGTVLLSTVRSVGVMGDERTYEHPVALRAVTSTDAMTADWAHLPYDFMAKVSNEIINKVKGEYAQSGRNSWCSGEMLRYHRSVWLRPE